MQHIHISAADVDCTDEITTSSRSSDNASMHGRRELGAPTCTNERYPPALTRLGKQWGVIWIIQGSPKRQRLSDCVRWRTPSVQKRHLVTLDQHLAPFRCLFANADLLPQYFSREGGPRSARYRQQSRTKPHAALCIPTNTCVWATIGIATVHEQMQNRCMHQNVRRTCPDF